MKKLLFLLFAGLFITACTNTDDDIPIIDDPDAPGEPIADCDIIEISGHINEPMIWEEGFVYVIDGFDVTINSLVTIKPGAIIKVRNARISVSDEGKILAEGTADKRIVFTSLADDRYCGDTNGDGDATGPEKGHWVSLTLNGSVGSVFKYVDIFYAGQPSGGTNQAVSIGWSQSVSFTFDHCRIAHTMGGSYAASYAFSGTSYMKDANVSKFTNNALYDNGRPIYFNTFYQLDPSNVFHNPEDPTVTNTHNGIYLSIWSSNPSNGESVNWDNTEVPYVSNSPTVSQIHSSTTINIKSGVIVKFINTGSGLQSSNGSVILDPGAILTSYKDDANGGDTNGDGNTTTPAVGNWEGFRITGSGIEPYWEQGSNILYAAN